MVDGQDLERLILWRAEVNGLNFTYFIFPSLNLAMKNRTLRSSIYIYKRTNINSYYLLTSINLLYHYIYSQIFYTQPQMCWKTELF